MQETIENGLSRSGLLQGIIKLPYRISADNFLVPQDINDSDDRDYDYIIPLTKELKILGEYVQY